MKELSQSLNIGDKILLGVDLKKSTDVILPAYNDSAGITSDFNLNLLNRINNELGADFNIDKFEHKPEYDELKGEARSYIVSKESQSVTIESIGKTFKFNEGERIHTEISQKYDTDKLNRILKGTGLEIQQVFNDQHKYFGNYILKKTFVSTG